jgi:hypothetical protein
MKEQKSRGWEMAVRVEKVIYMVDNETEDSSSLSSAHVCSSIHYISTSLATNPLYLLICML